jgi:hypothetical protein
MQDVSMSLKGLDREFGLHPGHTNVTCLEFYMSVHTIAFWPFAIAVILFSVGKTLLELILKTFSVDLYFSPLLASCSLSIIFLTLLLWPCLFITHRFTVDFDHLRHNSLLTNKFRWDFWRIASPGKKLHQRLLPYQFTHWTEISTVRKKWMFLPYLEIETTKGEKIILPIYLAKPLKFKESIEKYAGIDHPLSQALAHEQIFRREERRFEKIAKLVFLSLIYLMAIWLGVVGVFAMSAIKPLRYEMALYAKQHPTTPANSTAIALQPLMAELGLKINKFADGSPANPAVKVNKLAEKDWEALGMQPIGAYVSDRTEPSKPLPEPLVAYLQKYRSKILKIQQVIIDARSTGGVSWGDRAEIFKSNPDLFDPLFRLEILFVLNTLLAHQQGDRQQSLTSLEALWQIHQSNQTLPLYYLNNLDRRIIAKLLRVIKPIDPPWQDRISSQSTHKFIEKIAQNHRDSAIYDAFWIENVNSDQVMTDRIAHGYITLPYDRLLAAIYLELNTKRSQIWTTSNICSGVVPKIERSSWLLPISQQLLTFELDPYFTQITGLQLELTQAILQVNKDLTEGNTAADIARKFSQASSICPGEKWIATLDRNSPAQSLSQRSIEISFSHQIDPTRLPNHQAILLNYKVQS